MLVLANILYTIILHFALCKELIMDSAFPILTKLSNNYEKTIISFRFYFPQDSNGITYNQYIGVVFPESVSKLFLHAEFDCELFDSSFNNYTIKSIKSQDSLVGERVLNYTTQKENNILYCHFLDKKKLTLSTGTDVLYTLNIHFNKPFPSINFYYNIGLVTKTFPSPYGLIIDSLVIAGSIGLYSNNTQTLFTSTKETKLTRYNNSIDADYFFEIKMIFKTELPINNDFLMLIEIDDSNFDVNLDASQNIKQFIEGQKGIYKVTYEFGASYSKMVSFTIITTFYIKVKNFSFYKSNTIPNGKIKLLYRNSYTIIQENTFDLINIPKNELLFEASTPFNNTIYRNAAWKFTFNFTYLNPTYNKPIYARIYHNNAVEKYNELNFISSTCKMKSSFSSNKLQCFNDKNDYYFDFYNSSSVTKGSGYFFMLNTITENSSYIIDIWAYANNCGGLNYNNGYEYFTFTLELYDTIDKDEYNHLRFKEKNLCYTNNTNYISSENKEIALNDNNQAEFTFFFSFPNATNTSVIPNNPNVVIGEQNKIKCINNVIQSYNKTAKRRLFDKSLYEDIKIDNDTLKQDVFLFQEISDFTTHDNNIIIQITENGNNTLNKYFPIIFNSTGFLFTHKSFSIVALDSNNNKLKLKQVHFECPNEIEFVDLSLTGNFESLIVTFEFEENITAMIPQESSIFDTFEILVSFGYNNEDKYYPSKIIRFIKMFPFINLPKISTAGKGYTLYHINTGNKKTQGVCALQLDKDYLNITDNTSQKLFVWMVGVNLFETDYDDTEQQYPIYLKSSVTYNTNSYQSFGGLSRNNYYGLYDITNKEEQFKHYFDEVKQREGNNIPYHFMLGSLLIITFNSYSFSIQEDVIIPYYCSEDMHKNEFNNKHFYSSRFPIVISAYGNEVKKNGINSIALKYILQPTQTNSLTINSIALYNNDFEFEESSMNFNPRNNIAPGYLNNDNEKFTLSFNDIKYHAAFLLYQKAENQSSIITEPNTPNTISHYYIENSKFFYAFGKKFNSMVISLSKTIPSFSIKYSDIVIDNINNYAFFAFTNDIYAKRYFYSNFLYKYNTSNRFNYFKWYKDIPEDIAIEANETEIIMNSPYLNIKFNITSVTGIQKQKIVKVQWINVILANALCGFEEYDEENKISYENECEFDMKRLEMKCIPSIDVKKILIHCIYVQLKNLDDKTEIISVKLLGVFEPNQYQDLLISPINDKSILQFTISQKNSSSLITDPKITEMNFHHVTQADGIGILSIIVDLQGTINL